MSEVYNLEPQPTAKVVLETTAGDISLELFAKQTPLASRNFIQLCLEGYYDGTIFHRLVPGFIIQGGDPTGTGDGGEAIYDGGVFENEPHSRLKFNRRGLLGMANSGKANDNGSQFFLTLGKTDELTNKHTMFGRIVGDSIYNLMRMGDAELSELEGSERPLYPSKITKTEVLLNPFDDIVPRKSRQIEQLSTVKDSPVKKSKKKAGKALLSFGGDEGDTELATPVLKKPKFNSKLVAAGTSPPPESRGPPKKPDPPSRLSKRHSRSPPPEQPKQQSPLRQLPLRDDEKLTRSSSGSPEPEQVTKVSSLLDKTNAEIAKLKQSMKRDVPSATENKSKPKSALEQMVPESAIRGRKRKHGNASNNGGDAAALELLNKFRAKLDEASVAERDSSRQSRSNGNHGAAEKGADVAQDEEAQLCDLHFIANCQSCAKWDDGALAADNASDEDAGWMGHALTFEKDRLGKDLSWKKRNEEELLVIDPREKAKDLKAEAKAKKAKKIRG